MHTELIQDEEEFEEETSPVNWNEKRFLRMIQLRESALNYARSIWADYALVSSTKSLYTQIAKSGNSPLVPNLTED